MEFLVNKEDNMRTKRAMLLGVILLLMALLGACAVPAPSAPETVVFADENLDAAIRDALGKPAGGEAITAAELAGEVLPMAAGRISKEVSAITLVVDLLVTVTLLNATIPAY